MPGFKGFLRARAAAFPGDRRGNIAMLFGLSLIPILAIVGFAVDYTVANRQKALLQGALDTAVLAGVQTVAVSPTESTANAASAVKSFMAGNFKTKGTAPVIAVDTSVTGSVGATATLTLNNIFMKIAGIPTSKVVATSRASIGSGQKLELALVLDTTYSMTGAKLSTAQAAAANLVNTIYNMPNAANNVKIGLVPFNYYVNVGTGYAGASWLTSTATAHVTTSNAGYWTTPSVCAHPEVDGTRTCAGTNDGTPTSYSCGYVITPASGCSSGTPYYTAASSNTASYAWQGCVGTRGSAAAPLDISETVDSSNPAPALILNHAQNLYYNNCPTALQRLTDSSTTVVSEINSLTAAGETYIAPALMWGWRVLSPNAPFADGAAYGGNTTKTLVLMTDGFNTHSPNFTNSDHDHEASDVDSSGANLAASSPDKLEANYQTLQTCKAIQARGVTIYAIAFEVTDPVIKGVLQQCATSVSYYYDATTASSLTQAFASIGAQLTKIRLTQ